MKVVLLFPPHWEPMMPHLALPSLAAYLRSHGVEVIQRDLNIEIFDQVLSAGHLSALLARLRWDRRLVGRRGPGTPLMRARVQAMDWALEKGWQISADVDRAKEIIRSERFFEPELSLRAFFALTDGLRLASVPHLPSALRLTEYDSAYPPDSSQAILAAVRDRDLNLFHTLFERTIVPQIRRERPDLVGISLTSAHQVIAGFTLASLIKEAGIPAHITLGGKMITCWRDLLPQSEGLWELFDSAILFEGEVALLRLIEALDRGTGLASVPNLIYRDDSRIRINQLKPPEPVGALPIPDFDGLPLDLYLAPLRVLPVAASRGCYWGRCAFCNVGYGESLHFSEKRAARVAEETMALAEAYDTRHFFFADETLSPRMLRLLSAQLVEAGGDFNWTCCARFEPGISVELLKQMRRAGCRMVLYGLESGSQRVLDRMDKGIRTETAQRILREGAEAGIWNHVFIFFGFPGETEEEAGETVRFFNANRGLIHSGCTGTFLLERHARAADEAGAYEVSRLITRPERDLAYYYDYEVSSGISSARAEEIEGQFLESLPDKPFPQFYVHDIYRFLYASRFRDSEPFPTMLGEGSPRGSSAAWRTRVSIVGDKWYLNEAVTYRGAVTEGLLMNVRMVNAVFEDATRTDFDPQANTEAFISQIPDYVAHGIRAFTINLQGGMPGYEGAVNSAFTPDGSLREGYLRRVQHVIKTCDRQGAVVILGCYYQRQDQVLRDVDAVREGVMHVSRWVKSNGFTNVLLEITNEFGHSGFDHPLLRTPEGQVELIQLAQQTAPGLLVSTSGLGDGTVPASVARASDFILIHFNNTPLEAIPSQIAEMKRFGKPVVCNEDDKVGERGAQAAELCAAHGASWGFMHSRVNQYFPLTFNGHNDDPVVYAKLKALTMPERRGHG